MNLFRFASAETLHVGPGQTYTTIASAIAAAAPNDDLLIYDHVYTEQFVVDKPLSLTAVNVGGAVIDGGGAGIIIDIDADTSITGLHVTNAAIGIEQRNAFADYSCTRCIATNLTSTAFSLNNSGGSTAGNATILNSVILDSVNAVNINDGGTARIENSIIDGVDTAYVLANGISILPTHNLLNNVANTSVGPNIGLDPNELLADPLLVDPRNPDLSSRLFELHVGSPAIDSGLDVGLPFVGAAPDRGAIEYVPEPSAHLIAAIAILAFCVRHR